MPRRRPACHLPTPDELLLAPEVAILDALRSAIDVTIVAVTAHQPELWSTVDARDAVRTREGAAAGELIRSAQSRAGAVDAYLAMVTHRRPGP